MRVLAVNTDRIFLYNEEMQKMLADKVNLIFLRDSEFANLNNLFGCKFIRNEWSVGPQISFVIATDGEGIIRFSQPVY